MRGFVKIFIALTGALIVLMFVAIAIVGVKVGKDVSQKGLKNFIERVWEGPEN